MQIYVQTALLAIFGAFFALVFVVNNLVKTLARREKIDFLDLLLTFLATVLPILALVYNNTDGDLIPALDAAVTLGAAVVLVFSLLFIILEVSRPQRLRGSRGILGLWVSLLVALSVFTVPVLSERMAYVPPTPELIAQNGSLMTEEATDDAGATGAPRSSPTPLPTSTPTITRTPRPSPTPTNTRISILVASRTPAPSPTSGNPCLVTTLYNLRLRAEPNTESETLLVIPYSTTVTAFARNADSTWLFVTYEDQSGWIDAAYANASSACADLSVREE